ncbi:uncharacterized protein L203_102579 [Cryptococcus depauperatus CBS 7841]|uniref:non-specific serine/threonine protein kinase n=1 Tax=Cryptococcus depauperatus CBS 7841 TaxID=1295531 RepID=A0AAJ8LZX9_9TREE
MSVIPRSSNVPDENRLIWRPIGQTSNQLILYHPASHALQVRNHRPIQNDSSSNLSSILSLHGEEDETYGSIRSQPRCPYCSQPIKSDTINETRNTMPNTYFQTLEYVHGNTGPPVARRAKSTTTSDDAHDLPDDLPAQGYYSRFFKEECRLGMGAEGSVFLATHHIEGNTLGTYAVKKIAVGQSKAYLRKILHEVKLLETLRHSNIIPYHHAWIDITQFSSFGPPVPALHVLMMYANAGNLDHFIVSRSYSSPWTEVSAGNIHDAESIDKLPKEERIKAFKQRRQSLVTKRGENGYGKIYGMGGKRQENRGVMLLGLDEIMQLFGDVVEGLTFLHSHSILHLDLKCSNVLLHWEDDNIIPRAMISDFGTSEEMLLGKRQRTGHTGTMEYMAPETLITDANGSFYPSNSKADIWSLGMILYKMLYLQLPFRHSNTDDYDQLREEILTYPGFVPSTEVYSIFERRHIPRLLVVLLSKLANVSIEKRPTAEKVRIALHDIRRQMGMDTTSSNGNSSVFDRSLRQAERLWQNVRNSASPMSKQLIYKRPPQISPLPGTPSLPPSPVIQPITVPLSQSESLVRPYQYAQISILFIKVLASHPAVTGVDLPIGIVASLLGLAISDLAFDGSLKWTMGTSIAHLSVLLFYLKG